MIIACLPIESLTSALRIWLIARVLQPGIGLAACLEAEWANAAVAALTPSQSGGGAGQLYILTRAGATVGTALTISLISFAGTMAGLVLMGVYSLFVSHAAEGGSLFAVAVWALFMIAGAMALAATCPAAIDVSLGALSQASRRLVGWAPERAIARGVDIVYAYRRDVVSFLQRGKGTFAGVCLLSVGFLLARAVMPYLCLRFLGIDTWTLRQVVEAQIALIFLVFFAPTPGGAGIAEGVSLAMMADTVSVGFAPYYNLLWRFATMYLAAIAGVVCLCRAVIDDTRQVVHARRTLA